jgi:hypothetical protein
MSDGTLRFSERNSPPATPEVNTWGIYATSDGVYSIDDLGASVVLAATSDYNIAVATTDADGLLPKLSGSSDYFMDGTGNWGLPSPNGWLPAPGTWTASSDAITITTQAGSTDIYEVGDKLRFKQGGGFKFNYAIAVTDTTLTMTGSTDYEMTTDTITDNYYSHCSTPVGFPQYFNYTPTGISATNVTMTGRFIITGRIIHVDFYAIFTGTITFTTMPTIPVTVSSNFITTPDLRTNNSGNGSYFDSGTNWFPNGIIPHLAASATTVTLGSGANAIPLTESSPITWTSNDKISAHFWYEI